MNQINQVLLLLVFYLTGFLYLLPFRKVIGERLLILISFFVGLIIWVQAVVFNLAINNELKIQTLVLIVITGFIIVNLIAKLFGYTIWEGIKNISKSEARYFLLFIVSSMLASFFKYIIISPDSLVIQSMSQFIANNGVIGPEYPILFKWQSDILLIFNSGIHAIAYVFNVEVFYTLYPVVSIMFISNIFYFIKRERVCNYDVFKDNLYLEFGAILILLTSLVFFYHSFYLLSNLITSVYFCLGIIFTYNYLHERKFFWLILSIIFLAVTIQIRKEMLMFSLIPIPYVVYCSNDLSKRKIILLYTCFVIFYSWSLLMYSKNSQLLFFKVGSFLTHGDIRLDLLSIFSVSLIFLISLFNPIKDFIRNNFYLLLCIVCGFLICFLFLIRTDEVLSSLSNLLSFLFIPDRGAWGIFWLCFFSIVGYYLVNRHIWEDKMSYILACILLFFIFRLILFTIFTKIWDTHWTDSGNRILLQIFPVAVYFIFLTVNRTIKGSYNKVESYN